MKLKTITILISLIAPMYIQALDITTIITNRKSSNSTIHCGLFQSQDGFPTDSKKRLMGSIATIVDGKVICKFSNVSQGKYAISLLEDLNGNGVMDSTLVGYPKEPWGVSNNAPMHTFGPPTFEEAAFTIKENKIITIRLNQ